jgi:hypothetical protein
MKINELLYKTPEMTEEKLLKIMDSHLNWIKKDLKDRIHTLHKDPTKPFDFSQAFLDEYDLIQDKKSNLTRGQRNIVIGFVGTCMIEMTKEIEPNGGSK